MNSKRTTLRQIITKLTKFKNKEVLKAEVKSDSSYIKAALIGYQCFSVETLEAIKKWDKIFQVLKGKNQQQSINQEYYILSFKTEEKIIIFWDKSCGSFSSPALTFKKYRRESFKLKQMTPSSNMNTKEIQISLVKVNIWKSTEFYNTVKVI